MKTKTKTTSYAHSTHHRATTSPESTHAESAATRATATSPPATPQSSRNAAPSQLQALETACGFEAPMNDEARASSLKLVGRVPTTIVQRILALAGRQGGVVAGINFDPTAAKAALADADQADAIAAAAEDLATRARDHATRQRASVSGNVGAIRMAMRGFAKTTQGASLQSENDEIRSLAKQAAGARQSRKTRTVNEVKASATTTPPAPPGPPTSTPEPQETPAPAKTT